MNVRPIRTEEDYDAACKRIDEIFQAEPGTPEDDELEILLTLVEKYDDEHVSIRMPHPIDMMKMQMEALDINLADLARHLGESQDAVLGILNCERPLTVQEVRVLNRVLRIPTDVLLQEYQITQQTFHADTRNASIGA